MSVMVSEQLKNWQTLADACMQQASLGERTAFICRDQSISYAHFNQRADQLADWLVELGLVRGQRVALVAKDSLDSYALFFACAKLCAVLVPINWRLSLPELHAIVEDCDAKLVVCGHEYVERLQPSMVRRLIDLNDLPSEVYKPTQVDDTSPVESPCSEYPVVQIYTSGTTGKPKGVVLANRTFFQLMRGMRAVGDVWMDLSGDDTLLLSLPQFHIGGLWWAVQGFLAGATGVMLETFVGWQALELIQKHRVTKVPLVPAMLQFVMAEPDIDSADLSSVKAVLYGGSPIAPELLARAMERFRCGFFQIYGLTETGNMAVCLRPEDHAFPSRRRAAGRALPGVQISVVDPTGIRVPNYEIGEICLKSPSVMLEYFDKPNETNEVLHDGWIKTGDAGYLDDDGYLFVCDRVKDMIIYAGEKIFPAEVEAALLEHPAIVDVAVIGIPDLRSGELVKAFLVSKPETTQPKNKELLSFLRNLIADFKIPKSFEFVESLPRNPSGKLLKHVLRAPYWANLDRKVN